MDLLESVGSGAAGGAIGAIIAWVGIKARLDNIEKLIEHVVTEATCDARTKALSQRVNNATDRFDRIDSKIEIILKLLIDRDMKK
jgi:tetrahydromethanopterin S-methyltransferase subunit G